MRIGASCVLGLGLALAAARLAAMRAPPLASVTPIPGASDGPAPRASQGPAASSAVPPQPSHRPAGSEHVVDVLQVATRLTEQVGGAVVDVPSLARGLDALTTHWRRMASPWISPTLPEARRRLVQLVALRTSDREIPYRIVTSSGAPGTFDARKWNMSEGAYAQREAIFAPAPSLLRFRVRVPVAASLELAPAVLGGGADDAPDVAFEVSASRDGAAAPLALGRVVVSRAERDHWIESRFDMSALGGEEVDLELRAMEIGGPGARPSLALWGTPQITQRTAPRLPYDVLWIVVDALRSDVLASFHDQAGDELKRHARYPPGYTLLPAVPGLTPNLDALAARATIFRHAVSAAPWTRPGTIAMLAGTYSEHLGVSALPWSVPDPQVAAFYASRPPLLPLAFRRAGAATRAFVNNNFILGYAQVGVDVGFEQVEDFRYRTLDTAEITRATLDSARAHDGERTFTFVNFNSPHEPFDPPPECLERVPKRSAGGPADDAVRRYMAEACKDDAAIGELLADLDRRGRRETTLVVVTSDHGETLSEQHDVIAEGLDGVRTRFRHAFGMYEETTRIPIVLALPGVVPEGGAVDAPVSILDLAPTILRLEGLDVDPRQKGVDVIALARATGVPRAGEARARPADRPLVTMGRGTRAVEYGRWRYVERDTPAQTVIAGRRGDESRLVIPTELYDLVDDPGEIHNLATSPEHAATIAELRARLRAALDGVPAADAPVAEADGAGDPPVLHVRVAGGGQAHRFHARIAAEGATRFVAKPVGVAPEALHRSGDAIDVAFVTAAGDVLGFDLLVGPSTTAIAWTMSLDDRPLRPNELYVGPLGVPRVTAQGRPSSIAGVFDEEARAALVAPAIPYIDPRLDFGVFVTRSPALGDGAIERPGATSGAAAAEVKNALRQWGYAK